MLVDGWLRTGDVAIADDDGYLSLVDRKKDLVIVSGFNVFPAEVEEVLLAHPDDRRRRGDRDSEPAHRRSGRGVGGARARRAPRRSSRCGTTPPAHLARYKCRDVVEIVDALPRNEAGKLLRRELRTPS